jgi:hypothetical protein
VVGSQVGRLRLGRLPIGRRVSEEKLLGEVDLGGTARVVRQKVFDVEDKVTVASDGVVLRRTRQKRGFSRGRGRNILIYFLACETSHSPDAAVCGVSPFLRVPLLCRVGSVWGFVTLRQTFVRRCHCLAAVRSAAQVRCRRRSRTHRRKKAPAVGAGGGEPGQGLS